MFGMGTICIFSKLNKYINTITSKVVVSKCSKLPIVWTETATLE